MQNASTLENRGDSTRQQEANIVHISLRLCKMPALWKIGEIVPVNKKPLPKVDNDLRPVALTAILAKLL